MFESFIKQFEDFLSGTINKEIIFSKVEEFENELMDLEEKNQIDKEKLMEAFEILDNLRIILDEEDGPEEREVRHELKRLADVNVIPCKNNEVKTVNPLSDGKFRFSQPKFDFHPQMKSRLPADNQEEEKNLENIELKSSPLYNLLKASGIYLNNGTGINDLKCILKIALNEFLDLNQNNEDKLDEYSHTTKDILYLLSDMTEAIKESNFENEIGYFFDELEELNKKLLLLKSDIKPDRVTKEEIMDRVMAKISDNDFLTSNYVLIEDVANKFSAGTIDNVEFRRLLNEMLVLVRTAIEDYEDSYIAPEEWTLEVSIGDKLLTDGLKKWEEGLLLLNEAVDGEDSDIIENAIDFIFEGNKKLVINQYLAEYVKEQVNILSGKIVRGEK